MNRFFIVLVIALLAACTAPSTQTNQAPGSASGSASGAASAAASGEPAGSASAACSEAFAPLADMDISSISDLGDLAEVDATVENCESVADWTAGAQDALDIEMTPSTIRLLLGIRCDDPSLSSSDLCADLASS
jgi:hypothetical protein